MILCELCKIVNPVSDTAVERGFGDNKIRFILPVNEQTMVVNAEIKRKLKYSDKKTSDLLVLTVISDACESANKIVATIKIFRFANAKSLDTYDYGKLKETLMNATVMNGYAFGDRLMWKDREQWFYIEATKESEVKSKTYGAIVGQFIILISVCGKLAIEKIVDTLEITTQSRIFKCELLEERLKERGKLLAIREK
jgi:hypothetical protein